jgi:hypothetical protein
MRMTRLFAESNIELTSFGWASHRLQRRCSIVFFPVRLVGLK